MGVFFKNALFSAFLLLLWPRTLELKDEGKSITTILGTQSEGILVSSALEDLSERLEVQTQSHGSVASVHLKTVLGDEKRDQGNVSGVQSLHGNASRGALKVHLFKRAKSEHQQYQQFR